MSTRRYIEMQKRVTSLRHAMLPTRFSATGLYPDRVHKRTAAFRLLAHAEFESYLEDLVVEHVRVRMSAWETSGRPSITLAALLAYDEVGGRQPTSVLTPPQKPAKVLLERLTDAASRFNTQARVYNHGVREMNVLGMLLPIGLSIADIDLTWLASLDSWAKERGDFAHKSSGKIGTRLDPAREYARVKVLMAGFKELDGRVAAIL